MMSKPDVMTSKRRPDIMHESRQTPPCKTTFPSPGRVHGNSGQVCKKEQSVRTITVITSSDRTFRDFAVILIGFIAIYFYV